MGPEPETLLLFFGGSGRTRDEYERRVSTVIPGVDEALTRSQATSLRFVYVTAPYDIPFNRFDEMDEALDTWIEAQAVEPTCGAGDDDYEREMVRRGLVSGEPRRARGPR